MTPLRVLIVDDEAPARSRLARLLAPLVEDHRIETPEEAADGVEALKRLQEDAFDLAFLDVRMPEMDGFEVLEQTPPGRRPDVVFTTAYDEYAVRAFEANATDYLLKPVNAERLAEAVGRAESRRQRGEDTDERLAALLDTLDDQATDDAPAPVSGPMLDRFTIQGRDRLLVIDAKDVLAAEVQDGIINLYVLPLSDPRAPISRHIVSFTLDALEGRLDPEVFMRIHRNALVNVRRVREMLSWFSGRYKIVLDGGHEVVASRARSRELRDRLSL